MSIDHRIAFSFKVDETDPSWMRLRDFLEDNQYDGNALMELFNQMADKPARVFVEQLVSERRAMRDFLGSHYVSVVKSFRGWVTRHRKAAINIKEVDEYLSRAISKLWNNDEVPTWEIVKVILSHCFGNATAENVIMADIAESLVLVDAFEMKDDSPRAGFHIDAVQSLTSHSRLPNSSSRIQNQYETFCERSPLMFRKSRGPDPMAK